MSIRKMYLQCNETSGKRVYTLTFLIVWNDLMSVWKIYDECYFIKKQNAIEMYLREMSTIRHRFKLYQSKLFSQAEAGWSIHRRIMMFFIFVSVLSLTRARERERKSWIFFINRLCMEHATTSILIIPHSNHIVL